MGSFFPDTYPSYDSTKNFEHYKQVAKTQVFQPFVEDWKYPYVQTNTPYDLESISKIPISLITAENDVVCGP